MVNVLTEKQQVLERWKQYFKEVLNNELTSEHNDREIEIKNLKEDEEILPPTYNEVSNIIRKLKNNKAPGPDNIVHELIKEGGQKLEHTIQ